MGKKPTQVGRKEKPRAYLTVTQPPKRKKRKRHSKGKEKDKILPRRKSNQLGGSVMAPEEERTGGGERGRRNDFRGRSLV